MLSFCLSLSQKKFLFHASVTVFGAMCARIYWDILGYWSKNNSGNFDGSDYRVFHARQEGCFNKMLTVWETQVIVFLLVTGHARTVSKMCYIKFNHRNQQFAITCWRWTRKHFFIYSFWSFTFLNLSPKCLRMSMYLLWHLVLSRCFLQSQLYNVRCCATTFILICFSIFHYHHHHYLIIIIYFLTARVDGAPQEISQRVSSIFPCSPLPSGTWRTPGHLSCLPETSWWSGIHAPGSAELHRDHFVMLQHILLKVAVTSTMSLGSTLAIFTTITAITAEWSMCLCFCVRENVYYS